MKRYNLSSSFAQRRSVPGFPEESYFFCNSARNTTSDPLRTRSSRLKVSYPSFFTSMM